jgi:hypothetical protein
VIRLRQLLWKLRIERLVSVKIRLQHGEQNYRLFGIEQSGDWSIVTTWDRVRNGDTIHRYSSRSPEVSAHRAPEDAMRNGEGVYSLFTSVETRVVPRVKIRFADPELRIEVLQDRARPMMIPFRIFRGHHRVVKADLRGEIESIEFDAEL